MEPIVDFSWMRDLLTGQVVERIPLGDYRAVAVQVESSDERSHSQYHYRLCWSSPRRTTSRCWLSTWRLRSWALPA